MINHYVSEMSYKVEVTEEEHFPLLLETIADWSTQEHDVHLVTVEGLRVFSHKKLLSLYSKVIKDILNDPVVAFSPQIPTISVPVSANDVLLLFKVLEAGSATTNLKDDLVHIRNTAAVLGIEIKNLYLNENKKSFDLKSQAKSIIRLPASKVKDQVAKDKSKFEEKKVDGRGRKSFPDIPKSIEIFPKSSSLPKPVPVQKITNGNTPVISKSSDLRIELKEVIDEETKSPNNEEMSSEIPSTSTAVVKADLDDCVCNICGKLFENIRKVNRHKYKAHGKKSFKKDNGDQEHKLTKSTDSKKGAESKDKVVSSTEALVIKREAVQPPPPPQPSKPRRTIAPCELCPKVFNTEENLEKHKNQKHTKSEMPREAHKCDSCEKYFNNAANLQIHKRCHRDEVSSMKKCQICGSQFYDQEQLIAHMKDHEKEESQKMGNYNVEVTKHPDNPKTYGSKKDSLLKRESSIKSPLPLEMSVESLNSDIQSVVRDMEVDNPDDIAIEEEFSNIFDNAKKEMAMSSASNIQIETVESLASASQNTCGYCGDNFKDEDALNQHIAFMHC